MVRWALALALLFVACKKPVTRSDETGIALTMHFDAEAGIEQLRIEGALSDGSPVGDVLLLPRSVGGALADPQTLAILLQEDRVGQIIHVRVDGVASGVVVASGTGSVEVVRRAMSGLDVMLGAAAICGDGVVISALEACDDGALVPGDGCDASCEIEDGALCLAVAPSKCSVRCGDGVRAGSEACDDGGVVPGDGCDATCAIEPGFFCNGAVTSVCARYCGNGVVDTGQGESCDDGDRDSGDGCSNTCATESGYTCPGTPSACTLLCGNMIVDIGNNEECDDGDRDPSDGCDADCQVEVAWECPIENPSVCNRICGNGTINANTGEVCDGSLLPPGTTCWSAGYLDGTLGCNAACDGLVTAGCGTKIDNATILGVAIAQAIAHDNAANGNKPEVIGLHPGPYNLGSGPFDIDECPGTCGANPDGVHLRPVSGVVTIQSSGAGFVLSSPKNVIEGLRFETTGTAVRITSSEAAFNSLVNNEFFVPIGGAARSIVVSDSGASFSLIVQNWFRNLSATNMTTGILADGNSNQILLNVVYGRYDYAIDIKNSTGSLGAVRIDHNSVYLPSGSTAIRAATSFDLCFRGNLIAGGAATVGYELAPSATFGDSNTCIGTSSTANVVTTAFTCSNTSGNPCFSTSCAPNSGPEQLCAAIVPVAGYLPNQETQCLHSPEASNLVDAGPNLAYDYNGTIGPTGSSGPTSFTGAPPIGARESPSAVTYGGTFVSCP